MPKEFCEAREQVAAAASALQLWPEIGFFDEQSGSLEMREGIVLGVDQSNAMLMNPDRMYLLIRSGIVSSEIKREIQSGCVQFIPKVPDVVDVSDEVYAEYKGRALRAISTQKAVEDGTVIRNAWVALTD